MVKRTGITALVLTVLLFASCTGCKFGKIYSNASIENCNYLFNSSIIFTNKEKYRYTDEDFLYCKKLIKTYDELMDFQAELDKSRIDYEGEEDDEYYNTSREEFYENLDEEYFEKYALLIVCFDGSRVTHGSKDYKYSVKNISINEEGVLSVNIKEKKPKEMTLGVGRYLLLRADILKADLDGVTEVSVTMTES